MRITFAIGSRANWGSCRAVVERLRQEHQLHAVCYGTSILPRYGDVAKDVYELIDTTRIATHVEGGTPDAAATSAHLAGSLVGYHLSATRPDAVWVVGDRYEVGPVAYAAHVLGIKVFHSMGGECSGTIDDKIRHSITQLADLHFVATDKAAQRVQDMIGGPGRVYVTGCPRIDIASRCEPLTDPRPYVVVLFHPDCDTWQQAGDQMRAVLSGVEAAWDGNIKLFWPNPDPGTELIVQAARERSVNTQRNYETFRNLPDEDFYSMLGGAQLLVGNSSSFLRESSYIGTKAILVGDRQRGREMGRNVLYCVPPDAERIASSMNLTRDVWHDRERQHLYGDGRAAERIADALRA